MTLLRSPGCRAGGGGGFEPTFQLYFSHLGSLAFKVLAVLLMVPAADAKTVYVDADRTGPSPDGLSWSTAFAKVQSGIDAAAAGDEVWVAGATYYENITLKADVALYGGFDGSETELTGRNWTNNLTILDGRQTNSVIVVEAGATATTRIDGFVVRNGKAGFGGGILCASASPVIANNRILLNRAVQGGGGIRCLSSSPIIVSNLVQDNFANWTGGGIECVDSAPVIRNNRILGNSVETFSGGGIYCAGDVSPEIENNVVLGNSVTATSAPGGGGIFVNPETSARVINNTVVWNQARVGGGIYCLSNRVTLENNIIAYGSSGVAVGAGVPLVFQNNCVFGNGTRDYSGFPDQTGTNGNISADAGFVSISPFPDVHLAVSSPCRDGGNGGLVQTDWRDIDGRLRVQGPAVDIGADEFGDGAVGASPAIVRVSVSGNDADDGSSWARAKRTVQAGIDAASLSGGEVWVAGGTYGERIALRHFVYLWGGFGGNETNRQQRDWMAHPTTLDGNSGGRVISATWLQNWSAVDGFVVQNGLETNGAGIYVKGSSPVIANNRIVSNRTSGGAGKGGGLYCGDRTVITNNSISLNEAALGAGIYCERNSAPWIANNLIADNLATAGASGISGGFLGGGGICVDNAGAVVANNFLIRNGATNTASQLAYGGAIACERDIVSHPVVVANNTFLQNRAVTSANGETGGAIYSEATGLLLANNLVALGSSGIKVGFGSPVFHNNCVVANRWFDYDGLAAPTGTNGNISADPLLVSTNDFHLGNGSPCIDAGDDTAASAGWVDLDGQARHAGAHVDIGADEAGSLLPFVLELAALQVDGQPVLRLSGEKDRVYIFESSEDFTNWTGFSTNMATNSTLDVSDPNAPRPSHRYYRARAAP